MKFFSVAFLAASTCLAAVSATAAPVITAVGADYTTTPFTFTIGDSSFTFSGTGDIFGPTAIATGGTGQVNTIFGSPTTYFVDRGTVSFGAFNQFGAFPAATPIRFSNSDNFIGLRATLGNDIFYGFAFTTDSRLNSYGFETVAGQAITATTAVPEASTWAMILGGFAIAGVALRRRRAFTALAG